MTRRPETIGPKETLRAAALKMKEKGVGALVVLDDDRLLGIITDRDIVVRSTAKGDDPFLTSVERAMTTQVVSCFDSDDLARAAELMEEKAVRRLLVLDSAERLAGILSIDDLARYSRTAAGEVIDTVQAPERPTQPELWPWWGDEATP